MYVVIQQILFILQDTTKEGDLMANKDPIFTDITNAGRIDKFADPQHFTGPDNSGRARTGEKNPFPSMLYGVNSDGEPTPVNVDKDGNVLTQLTGSNVEEEYLLREEVVSAGSQRYFDFVATPSFRVLGRLHKDASESWAVALFPELDHFSFPYASALFLIESKDGQLQTGKGSRGAAYTDVLNVISKLSRIYIYNNSSIDLTFSLLIVKYSEMGSSDNEV